MEIESIKAQIKKDQEELKKKHKNSKNKDKKTEYYGALTKQG